MTKENMEKRIVALEMKGKTAWGKLNHNAKMLVAGATVLAVVYLLVQLHVL